MKRLHSAELIGYLDLPSGVSGDMLLGCLIDAGWSVEELIATIEALRLPSAGWSIATERVMRGPLVATLVHVTAPEEHHHRHLSDIRSILDASALPHAVQSRAIEVFTRLAAAEAKVHGTDIESIHFHEVGALDAIIDVVGVCAGLHALGITALYAGALPLGGGWVTTEHGRLPLPAPATLELLAAAGAPTQPAPGPGELVTPTGAALVCTLATFGQPAMTLQRIGYGAGQKEFAWPNVARLWLGHPLSTNFAQPTRRLELSHELSHEHRYEHSHEHAGPASMAQMVQIETNIDDMNPELYGPLVQRLLSAGAADVWLTPIYMKKGRPGTLVGVLAPVAQEAALVRLLLEQTTTLGVRSYRVHRTEAERSFTTVDTPYGPVRIKLKHIDGVLSGVKPEHDDCMQLAEAHQVPPRYVEMAALSAAYALLHSDPDR